MKMTYIFKRTVPGECMITELTNQSITDLFKLIITELHRESFHNPEKYAVVNGTPDVKVAVGNIPLTYDLWKGLKNPASVGLYPVGLQEIWEFYAHRRKTAVDESGRHTIFQVPHSFEHALERYKRAVIISVMLPLSCDIINEYTEVITEREKGSSYVFARMSEEVNTLLDKATTRAALHLVRSGNVVIPMDNETVKSISQEAIPVTRQGSSHGPSKGGNYPQKSVAALLGLGQFGVHRIVFRDEITDNSVERVTGPLRSIIIFDDCDLVTRGKSILYLTELWRHFLFKLYDFTITDPEINKYRFCSYIPADENGCGICADYCPSGAQASSIPDTTGRYPEETTRQKHRFWEGVLQFDYNRCCEERGQMASLFPEWSCARGLSMCVSKGIKRKDAVRNFYRKMEELTRE